MTEQNNTPRDLAKRGALAAFGLVAAAGAAVIGNRKADAQGIIPSPGNISLPLSQANGGTGGSALPTDHVATIAALQSYSGTSNCVYVDTYVSGAPVEGGGVFVWSSTSTATVDSGTIFSSSSRGSTGRWLRQFDGPLTPLMFGAYGDNSHVDTTAIQNCFLAGYNLQISINMLGLVYLTAPVFASFVSGSPAGTSATVEASCAPEINGNNCIFNAAGTFTGALFNYQNVANCIIRGLQVNAANSAGTAALGPTAIDTSWNVAASPAPSQLNVYDHVRADGASTQAWLATENNDSQFIACVGTTTHSTASFPIALNIAAAGGGIRFIACEWYGVVSGVWQTCDVVGGVDQGWNITTGSNNIITFFGGYHYSNPTTLAVLTIGYGAGGTPAYGSNGVSFIGGACFLNQNNSCVVNGPGRINNGPNGVFIEGCSIVAQSGVTGSSIVGSSLNNSWGVSQTTTNSIIRLAHCNLNTGQAVALNSPNGGTFNGIADVIIDNAYEPYGYNIPGYTSNTTLAVADITGYGQEVTLFINGTLTTNITLTTPTVAAMYASLYGSSGLGIPGKSYKLRIVNTTSTYTITMAAGTGWTISGLGSLQTTILSLKWREFIVIFNNSTSISMIATGVEGTVT